MKRSVIFGLVALATTSAIPALASVGGIVISNYQEPYNPVVWGAGVPLVGGTHVLSTQGVQLSLWYGEGNLTADQLTFSLPCLWNTNAESSGYTGYYRSFDNVHYPYNSAVVQLPDWAPGDTYTFQVRAYGVSPYGPIDESRSFSALWQEKDDILDISGIPPGPPGLSHNSIGFTVYIIPEPSAMALLGLGLAGLAVFRRRR